MNLREGQDIGTPLSKNGALSCVRGALEHPKDAKPIGTTRCAYIHNDKDRENVSGAKSSEDRHGLVAVSSQVGG